MPEDKYQLTSGYSSIDFQVLVENELKSILLTADESNYLLTHRDRWHNELVRMKKKTEMQLASSKTRAYTLYVEKLNNRLTELEYADKLKSERLWKINAHRFLQQVETRIQGIKVVNV